MIWKHVLMGCLVACWLSIACDDEPRRRSGAGVEDDGEVGAAGDADTDADVDGDADADADADADGDSGGVEVCTLTGNVGLAVGDLAQDLTVYECDGTPVQMHQLFCRSPYTFLYSYAGW